MTRQRFGLLALVVASLAASGCGGGDDDSSAPATTGEAPAAGGGATLNGSVGPGFEISLDGTDGLTAGDYSLVVDDLSGSHNFHLTGPGVDVTTDVGGEGQETFKITLQAGEYRFVCDPHATQMQGSFTVG